jgi:hypothetical protein
MFPDKSALRSYKIFGEMLMVVFGAGASYDSVASKRPAYPGPESEEQYRPPLANALFEPRPWFVEVMNRFPDCQPIIPYLQFPTGGSVEQELEHLQSEASEYPVRHRQLAAIRYYLHFMLWECGRGWHENVAKGITNYKTLLDQLQRWRKPRERICIVTFNYDQLLEAALPSVGLEIKGIPDYIAGNDWKVIKLHGSVNWGREVDTPMDSLKQGNVWEVAHELIRRAAELSISDRYRMVNEYPIARSGATAVFPALAIPVETKRQYECPPEHLETLDSCITQTDRLLMIGWRATEVPFLEWLKTKMPKKVRGMAVAGDINSAVSTITTLQRFIDGDFSPADGGFTEFVIRRQGEDFLKS